MNDVPHSVRAEAGRIDAKLLDNVEVVLEARLGETTMTVADLLALKAGVTVKLDTSLGGQATLVLNGKTIAHGEIVAVDDCFGIRIEAID